MDTSKSSNTLSNSRSKKPDAMKNTARAIGLTLFFIRYLNLFIISSNLLIGSFSYEVALITSAGERSQTSTLAGTDNLPGQAVLYATAHQPLVGEEMYAGGAYLGAGPMHEASLHAQDVIRWITIGLIIVFSITDLLKGLL